MVLGRRPSHISHVRLTMAGAEQEVSISLNIFIGKSLMPGDQLGLQT